MSDSKRSLTPESQTSANKKYLQYRQKTGNLIASFSERKTCLGSKSCALYPHVKQTNKLGSTFA